MILITVCGLLLLLSLQLAQSGDDGDSGHAHVSSAASSEPVSELLAHKLGLAAGAAVVDDRPAPGGTDPGRLRRGGPRPGPARGSVPPYGGGCAGTWNRSSCNCSGVRPPFGAPARDVTVRRDYHFPESEAAERAALVVPELVDATGGSYAVLRDPSTGETALLSVGSARWGWELLQVGTDSAVVEHDFDEWSELRFLWTEIARRGSVSVRKPVGILSAITQPIYDMVNNIDPDYHCKQDIDPTDWLGRLAANISGGEEASVEASITLMAPNTDSGLFGNPEDRNKFLLTHTSQLMSMPWGDAAGRVLWTLTGSSYVPPSCAGVTSWEQVKMGHAGEHLRVVNQGMWHPTHAGGGCGVEITAVSPPPLIEAGGDVSSDTAALLRVTSHEGAAASTAYLRAAVAGDGAGNSRIDDMGGDGAEFYAAVLANAERWGAFVDAGAKAALPRRDRRYAATANALLTMYMNTDRGYVPQYGGGQFWNTYNTYLPLDTLALNGALLEWGHTEEALAYLTYFFTTYVCMEPVCVEPIIHQYGREFGGNASFGGIIYGPFGCDSDADYGRLMDLFVRAVQYSGNATWAIEMLPIVQALAQNALVRRAEAVAAFPAGHPFHGMVYGSPEHDICTAPSFYFSLNAWFVRGLLSLAQLHAEYPALTHNATLEADLLPTAKAWREDIRSAANFTAVRRSDGGGLFFLHPVVGSAYSESNPPYQVPLPPTELIPIEGGDESTCIARGTCFASMTAGVPGQANGGSNQNTNYANFRIFSETLLAGVLDPEYEEAIMDFRESHRGTLLGMTRFRDVLDDMPILGYGKGSLAHDRLYSFHNTLAGHSLNYISRGTYWGTEQRQQLDYTIGNGTGIVNHRWRNDCGVAGEDCSLCMVSGVASSYWVRWMLVSEHPDDDVLYLCRGAPRRWYATVDSEPFGMTNAPTRFGKVNFTMRAEGDVVHGSVQLAPRGGVAEVAQMLPLVAVKIRSADATKPLAGSVTLKGCGAVLVAWHASNETAVIKLNCEKTAFAFNFTVK